MNFQIKIKVDGIDELVILDWSAEDLQDVKRLQKHLVEEFELLNGDFADDWEVMEDMDAPFWVKSPGEVVNGAKGRWLASNIDGRDEEALLSWVRASQVVMVALQRGLDPAVMLHFAFSVGVKDPVEFAEAVNLPDLVEAWWKEFFQLLAALLI